MPAEPFWLTADHVRAINRAEIEASGAEYSVVNDAYIEGACARPRNQWHYEGERDLVTLAVTLLFAVAQSHAFLDGNKRTGFYAAVVFLQANGISVPNLDAVELAEIIVSVIEKKATAKEFEAALRAELDFRDP